MSDAVAFMCIFLDFKRVEPATTAAARCPVAAFLLYCCTCHEERKKRGALSFYSLLSFCREKFSISSDPLLRSKDGFFSEHKSLNSLHNASKVFFQLNSFSGKDNEMQHQLSACKSPFFLRPCPGSEDPHPT